MANLYIVQNVLLSSTHCHTCGHASDHLHTRSPTAWYNVLLSLRLWSSPECDNKGSLFGANWKKKKSH